MYKNILYILLLINLISACRPTNTPSINIENILVNTRPMLVDYDSLVDSVKCILLETTEETMLKNIDKVIFQDSTIVILSKNIGVYGFTLDGRFKHHFGCFGQAPGEYTSCFDISAENDSLFIYDNHQQQLHQYGIGNAQYIRSLPVPDSSLEVQKYGGYLFSKTGKEPTTLCVQNLESKRVDTLINSVTGPFDLQIPNQMVKSGKDLLWLDPLRYSVHRLSNPQKPNITLKFDFGDNGLTEEDLRDLHKHSDLKAKGKVIFFSKFYESPQKAIASYQLNNKGYTLIYDKQNQRLHNIEDFSLQLKPYQHFSDCVGVWGDYFCMVKHTAFIQKRYEEFIKSGEKLPQKYNFYRDFEHISDKANPILYFVKYK